ncbi:dehydrogenase/reductase SDR family member 11-like [Penaeus japonicus]|uniref:dehydrogenase/reductase SDR family member 11-like n=1 Tax=Penaeus japonicus TaxID=27405 RepID=UPI001C70E507|nr:dehydrogenase/reductase SDR family member 11-like [Penaeus japonicus]XP_042859668.1 dehydrogenase/reductase SDR family member 11-like [Penaeus japonicus]XP_042859669.1 dehydrogenase/reductase SDR family member 11-like [Penaeus japonicus]XP_042859670.1 dehydrogenase/reductase SDR family member 11-like [Penaeus japonicus]
MERWVGRVALVTGASVGIGAAICRQLVGAGMKVVGAARSVEKIQALSNELSGKPGSLTAMKCDLSKDSDVMNLFTSIKQQFGGVDVCINNAGLSHNHSLLDGTPEEWREMLDVNVVALCLCTREAVASMRERNVDDGQIIHISSMSGHRVTPNPAVHFYTATKYAVTALLEGLRLELRDAKSHIRVAAVSPGIVETEFAPRMQKSEAGRKLYTTLECLQPDDIASSVLHVLSAPPHVQIHDILVRPTEQAS